MVGAKQRRQGPCLVQKNKRCDVPSSPPPASKTLARLRTTLPRPSDKRWSTAKSKTRLKAPVPPDQAQVVPAAIPTRAGAPGASQAVADGQLTSTGSQQPRLQIDHADGDVGLVGHHCSGHRRRDPALEPVE